MTNARVFISPFNDVVLETWDRAYELETVLTVDKARALANELLDMAAEAAANRALTSDDMV